MPISALALASPRGPLQGRSMQIKWIVNARSVHSRATLSQIWLPTGGLSEKPAETGHDRLLRAGFVRQSQVGIFQLLPLGLRVQNKIEKLLDKHMQTLGASRVALSAISSQALWQKSGRLEHVRNELFCFTDQKETDLILSPTHEEEITKLVAETLNSYKSLPLRLYQMTPKYRDEKRPRAGLLRSREFLMKDLYTFDLDMEAAQKTYNAVGEAYEAFFSDLRLPVIIAEASSGAMGGNHSHEYHLAHPMGEDTVMNCDNCGYAANDEVVTTRRLEPETSAGAMRQSRYKVWHGITKDRQTLVNAWYPDSDRSLNQNALKTIVPSLDTSIMDVTKVWNAVINQPSKDGKIRGLNMVHVVDFRLGSGFNATQTHLPDTVQVSDDIELEQKVIANDKLDLLEVLEGDSCPRCPVGKLKINRALELGHSFYLGTRYSEPLNATFKLPHMPKERIPIQMGCYGIGISRIIGTIAEHMSDANGLVWPRRVAPYQVVIVPTVEKAKEDAEGVYDLLTSANAGLDIDGDVIVDDREAKFGWKMKDATMTGYPVVIIIGNSWSEDRIAEVECRRLGLYQRHVKEEDLMGFVRDILQQL